MSELVEAICPDCGTPANVRPGEPVECGCGMDITVVDAVEDDR